MLQCEVKPFNYPSFCASIDWHIASGRQEYPTMLSITSTGTDFRSISLVAVAKLSLCQTMPSVRPNRQTEHCSTFNFGKSSSNSLTFLMYFSISPCVCPPPQQWNPCLIHHSYYSPVANVTWRASSIVLCCRHLFLKRLEKRHLGFSRPYRSSIIMRHENSASIYRDRRPFIRNQWYSIKSPLFDEVYV